LSGFALKRLTAIPNANPSHRASGEWVPAKRAGWLTRPRQPNSTAATGCVVAGHNVRAGRTRSCGCGEVENRTAWQARIAGHAARVPRTFEARAGTTFVFRRSPPAGACQPAWSRGKPREITLGASSERLVFGYARSRYRPGGAFGQGRAPASTTRLGNHRQTATFYCLAAADAGHRAERAAPACPSTRGGLSSWGREAARRWRRPETTDSIGHEIPFDTAGFPKDDAPAEPAPGPLWCL
jgi:hypothetical protein